MGLGCLFRVAEGAVVWFQTRAFMSCKSQWEHCKSGSSSLPPQCLWTNQQHLVWRLTLLSLSWLLQSSGRFPGWASVRSLHQHIHAVQKTMANRVLFAKAFGFCMPTMPRAAGDGAGVPCVQRKTCLAAHSYCLNCGNPCRRF